MLPIGGMRGGGAQAGGGGGGGRLTKSGAGFIPVADPDSRSEAGSEAKAA